MIVFYFLFFVEPYGVVYVGMWGLITTLERDNDSRNLSKKNIYTPILIVDGWR